MKADKRLWRTNDDRLVLDGDAAAVTLAYAEGDELSAEDQKLVKRDDEEAEKATPAPAPTKAAEKPADKSRKATGNK